MSLPDVDVGQLSARLLLIRAHLDERAWRLLLGAEAKVAGPGWHQGGGGGGEGASGHLTAAGDPVLTVTVSDDEIAALAADDADWRSAIADGI